MALGEEDPAAPRREGSLSALEFLAGDSRDIAPALLGAVLVHAGVAVRLSETEAYAGAEDPGSHAFRGRTPRNEVMFGPPGRLYVYFIYGMHFCANVITGPEGVAGGVLLRAGEVIAGIETARDRSATPGPDIRLARGPARLARVLAFDRSRNGAELSLGRMYAHSDGEPRDPWSETLLDDAGPALWLAPDSATGAAEGDSTPREVRSGPRVGLRHAADRPWRFWVANDLTVTDYRPAAKRS